MGTEMIQQNQVLTESLTKLWNIAPEEIREAAPVFFQSILTIPMAASMYESTQCLSQIAKHLHPENVLSPEVATHLINETKRFKIIANNQTAIHTHLTSSTPCEDVIRHGVTNQLASAGNWLLASSAICGAVQLIISGVGVYNLFQAVKKAQSLGRSVPIEIAQIEKRIEKIPAMIAKLDAINVKLRVEGISPREINFLLAQSNRERSAVDQELGDILEEIGKLEMKIGTSKTTLENARKMAAVGAIGGLASGASGLTNVAVLASVSNPIIATIAGVIAAANFVVGVVSGWKYFSSSGEFDKLVGLLNEVHKLRKEAKQQQTDLSNKTNDLMLLIQELSC